MGRCRHPSNTSNTMQVLKTPKEIVHGPRGNGGSSSQHLLQPLELFRTSAPDYLSLVSVYLRAFSAMQLCSRLWLNQQEQQLPRQRAGGEGPLAQSHWSTRNTSFAATPCSYTTGFMHMKNSAVEPFVELFVALSSRSCKWL